MRTACGIAFHDGNMGALTVDIQHEIGPRVDADAFLRDEFPVTIQTVAITAA